MSTIKEYPQAFSLAHSVNALRKPRRITWSRDGDTLLIPADTGLGGELTIWCLSTGRVSALVDCDGKPVTADMSVQKKQIAYGTQNGKLVFFDPTRKFGSMASESIDLHSDNITQVEWSPDGMMLASVSHDQAICILSGDFGVRTIRRIQTTRDRHNAVSWSPTGKAIAVCGTYYGIQLFQAETGHSIWQSDYSNSLNFLDLAWSPRANAPLAVALSDGRIRLINSQNGSTTFEIEGHTNSVVSLAYSTEGTFLFSLGLDNSLKVWHTDTLALVAEWTCRVDDAKYCSSIACHPTLPILAAPSEKPSVVQIFKYDSKSLTATLRPVNKKFRTRAKVALVGHSEIGKSSVALRLVANRYEPGKTTHGVHIQLVPTKTLDPTLQGDDWSDREVLLWDLGGQKDYQLIHQLFLHETALALIMCDPSRRDAAYYDVESWMNKLRQQSRGQMIPAILVGTKVDEDIGTILEKEIEQLRRKLNVEQYVATSAKFGLGIDLLGKAIVASIDWGSLERIVRPDLFQVIRDKIEQLRASGEVISTVPELIHAIQSDATPKFSEIGGNIDEGAVNIVVTQLSLQGLIAETRLADSTRVLVLQITEIERYAGSLLLMASNNPSGIPTIDELSLISPTEFPGIAAADRLPRAQERSVVQAVVQMLLQNGLCLRHEGTLVFPGKITTISDAPIPDGFDTLFEQSYFAGAIENIYTTLIASLSNSRRFGRLRPWPGRVEFVGPGATAFGISCAPAGPGQAKLYAFASTAAQTDERKLFLSYIHDHFSRMGVEVKENIEILCRCGEKILDRTLRARIALGYPFIVCAICDTKHELSGIASGNHNIDFKVAASRIHYDAVSRANELSALSSRTLAFGEVRSEGASRTILHLSDLHIGKDTDPDELLVPLQEDLRGQHVSHLDYLVISGDVTNTGAEEEFEIAFRFVSTLMERFSLSANRAIVAPGNHDVNWNKQVYDWKPKRQVSREDLVRKRYPEQGSGYLIRRDDDEYEERFANFADKFFHLLKLRSYPLEPKGQFLVESFFDDKIQFVSLNTSWEIDEFHTDRASIHPGSLNAALDELRSQTPKSQTGLIRIAVFHHPVSGNEGMKNDSFMGLLQQAGFRVCLHGHVHTERADLFNYLHPKSIHIVGAGSFGALAAARPEATPRLYNLIQVDAVQRKMRVNTRSARNKGGAWGNWNVWPGPDGQERSWYEISL